MGSYDITCIFKKKNTSGHLEDHIKLIDQGFELMPDGRFLIVTDKYIVALQAFLENGEIEGRLLCSFPNPASAFRRFYRTVKCLHDDSYEIQISVGELKINKGYHSRKALFCDLRKELKKFRIWTNFMVEPVDPFDVWGWLQKSAVIELHDLD